MSRRTATTATIPIGRLPSIRLLEEVFDSRKPDEIGKFQKWAPNRMSGKAMAQVVFPPAPGRHRVRYIGQQYVRRVSSEMRERTRLRTMFKRQERQYGANPDILRMEAAQFGLTIDQYLDAIS